MSACLTWVACCVLPMNSWYDLRVRKVDISLPGKGNSNSHGARPVHLIITIRESVCERESVYERERVREREGVCVCERESAGSAAACCRWTRGMTCQRERL